jgi:hypothetical protein
MNTGTLYSAMAAIVAMFFSFTGAIAQNEYIAPCEAMSEPPDFKDEAQRDKALELCPGNPDILLGVVFDGQYSPRGIGGGTVADNGNKNDKKVDPYMKICWVAINEEGLVQDDTAYAFNMLFSPDTSPGGDKPYATMNVNPRAPSKASYKYSVWSSPGATAEEKACNFLDPYFVVN